MHDTLDLSVLDDRLQELKDLDKFKLDLSSIDAVIDAIDTALQEYDNFSDIFSDKK